MVLIIQALGEGENVPVALRGGPYDHLGGLARRGKPWGVAVELQLLFGGGDAVPDLLHGGKNSLAPLVRGQPGQALGAGQLDIHAQPVRQQPQPMSEQGVGPGDGLGVDIAPKAVLLPEKAQRLNHPLRGVVGILNDR